MKKKTKFLEAGDLTISQISFKNKKRIEIEKEAAFFLLANGKHSIAGSTLSPNPQFPIKNIFF